MPLWVRPAKCCTLRLCGVQWQKYNNTHGVMAAVPYCVKEMTKRRSRREHVTRHKKFTTYCKKERKQTVFVSPSMFLSSSETTAVPDLWSQNQLGTNFVKSFISCCCTFLFLAPDLAQAMRRAQNRRSGPGAEPPKDHSWSWLKARQEGQEGQEGRPDDECYRHHHLLSVKQFVMQLSLESPYLVLG